MFTTRRHRRKVVAAIPLVPLTLADITSSAQYLHIPLSHRVQSFLAFFLKTDYHFFRSLPVNSVFPFLCCTAKRMPRFVELRRSTENKIIGGVCAGIAQWLGWKATTVRILFMVGSFVPIIPGFVVYLILWIILPKESGWCADPLRINRG
jgi:phage shock protein C